MFAGLLSVGRQGFGKGNGMMYGGHTDAILKRVYTCIKRTAPKGGGGSEDDGGSVSVGCSVEVGQLFTLEFGCGEFAAFVPKVVVVACEGVVDVVESVDFPIQHNVEFGNDLFIVDVAVFFRVVGLGCFQHLVVCVGDSLRAVVVRYGEVVPQHCVCLVSEFGHSVLEPLLLRCRSVEDLPRSGVLNHFSNSCHCVAVFGVVRNYNGFVCVLLQVTQQKKPPCWEACSMGWCGGLSVQSAPSFLRVERKYFDVVGKVAVGGVLVHQPFHRFHVHVSVHLAFDNEVVGLVGRFKDKTSVEHFRAFGVEGNNECAVAFIVIANPLVYSDWGVFAFRKAVFFEKFYHVRVCLFTHITDFTQFYYKWQNIFSVGRQASLPVGIIG